MFRGPALFFVASLLGLVSFVAGCAASAQTAQGPRPSPARVVPAASKASTTAAPRFQIPDPEPEILPGIALGIDVLEESRFAAIAGKRIGLLTHQAGVNRRGQRTIDVIRRAPNTKLVALFAPEHGLEGIHKAGDNFGNEYDARTGLIIYSLHGASRAPTAQMLKGIDALVIDLQDIGSRSYTFISCMREAMAGCFKNGVEVIVLDRPNPLGGLKVGGPPLDQEWVSYIGAFRVPYVHGLTMGELARLAKDSLTTLTKAGTNMAVISDQQRLQGKLTVIPMRGWTRGMRWPDTGLKWIKTSPMVPDFNAAVGYAIVGPGTEIGGWTWGIGTFYPFRGIGFPKRTPEQIIAEFSQYKIPGIKLVRAQGIDPNGKVIGGVYVDVTDWDDWRPTELSFYMMKTAAKWNVSNPFIAAPAQKRDMFNKVVGSSAWWRALNRDGARVDVAAFFNDWDQRAKVYQQQSRKYWLYQ